MGIDFRKNYRVVSKFRYQQGIKFHVIQTKACWRPWWKTLNGYDLFTLRELCRYQFVENIEEYPTERMAEEVANLYARNGRMVFVKRPVIDKIKPLGKLPKKFLTND